MCVFFFFPFAFLSLLFFFSHFLSFLPERLNASL